MPTTLVVPEAPAVATIEVTGVLPRLPPVPGAVNAEVWLAGARPAVEMAGAAPPIAAGTELVTATRMLAPALGCTPLVMVYAQLSLIAVELPAAGE